MGSGNVFLLSLNIMLSFSLNYHHRYHHSYLSVQLPTHVSRYDCHHLHHAAWSCQRNVKSTLFVAGIFAVQFASQTVSLAVQD